jgi:hypothetical protein
MHYTTEETLKELKAVNPDYNTSDAAGDAFGYTQRGKIDNKWVFNQFDEAWAWGYTVLEWNETKAHVYHVKPARHYVGGNGEFDFTETIENELTITFNR